MTWVHYQFIKGKHGQPDRVMEESASDSSDPYSLRVESHTGEVQDFTGYVDENDHYGQRWTAATEKQIAAIRARTGWSGRGPLTLDRDLVEPAAANADNVTPGIRLMGDEVHDPYDMNRDGVPDWWHDPARPRPYGPELPPGFAPVVLDPGSGQPVFTWPSIDLGLPPDIWGLNPSPAEASPIDPADDPGYVNPSMPVRPFIDSFFSGSMGRIRMGPPVDLSGHVQARKGGIVFGTLPKVVLKTDNLGRRRNG